MSEVLHGNIVRLEPLEERHAEGLVRASMSDDGLYKWSPVPKSIEEVRKYIQTALEWKEAGTALPYAIIRNSGGYRDRFHPVFSNRAVGLETRSSEAWSCLSGCCRNRLYLAGPLGDSHRCQY